MSGQNKTAMSGLVLGATGVVFGDIGTSPIYALHETFAKSGTEIADIFGVVSLVFWTLFVIVTIKYLTFVMRADNNGEGGILALLSLLPPRYRDAKSRRDATVFTLILIGTALLFGDGVLTPAISVLSATEGLALVNPDLANWAVPLTVVILLALFAVQHRGTHKIGQVFGPVMVLWFVTLGGLGLYRFFEAPSVIKALSPTYGAQYVGNHGWASLTILSSVILSVTGAEALYADMGHFGARPIRIAWATLVWPALILCYLGQAAHVTTHPEAIENPFFSLAPGKTATLILVALATAATVIASQALITGVFSLSRQAISLGLFPRLYIHHTSDEHEGQIYVPLVNWLVGFTSILLVALFQSSSALAHAYVLAIAGTMGITTLAFHRVARDVWGFSRAKLLPLVILFAFVDTAFFLGTAANFLDGGWVPVFLGGLVLTVMIIWRKGYRALGKRMGESSKTWQEIYDGCQNGTISTLPGIGVFLASPAEIVPSSLGSHVDALHSLPESIVVVTVRNEMVPYAESSVEVDQITERLSRVVVPMGYMEQIDLPEVLRMNLLGGLESKATYYLSERRFLATDSGSLGHRTEAAFAILHRNSTPPTQYFKLPYDRVITLGTRIDL